MLIATGTRFVLFLPVDINIVCCPYSTQLFCIFSHFVLYELNTVTEYYSESGQTLQLNTAVNHFALSRHYSWILQWINSYCPNTTDKYYSESYRWILQWIISWCPNTTDEYYSEWTRAVQTLQLNTTVNLRTVQTLQTNTTVNQFVLSKHYRWILQCESFRDVQTRQMNTTMNHFVLSKHYSWSLQWNKSYCPNTTDEYYSESFRAAQTLQLHTTVNQAVLSKYYQWIPQWINSCCLSTTAQCYSESDCTLQVNTTVNH